MREGLFPDEDPGWSPAIRVLARSLRTVSPDSWRYVLDESLAESRKPSLPTEPADVLRFARTYMAPRLSIRVRPQVVLALLDDVTTQLHFLASGGTSRSPWPTARRSTTASGGLELDPAERVKPGATTVPSAPRTAKLRDSVAKLTRTTSTCLRASGKGAIGRPTPNTNVLLVSRDRLERSILAKALVTAGFDVNALDAVDHALDALRGHSRPAIALLSLEENIDSAVLRRLAAAHPALPVVYWTSVPATTAERLMAGAGFRFCSVAPRTASSAQLVEAIRQLLHTSQSAAHGSGDPERDPT